MIIIGASLILFEYPVREIRQISDEVGAILLYDAAHVAGLITGNCWQHPLREGAHVMTASTYKSFGGPPGGIVVTNDPDIAKGVDRAVFPGMTANFHTQRLPALAVAAAEMIEYGAAYARACCENAQALAAAFETQHLTVAGKARGYSDGHMLALDVSEAGGGYQAAQALEKVHIICNMNLLPWDPMKAVRNPSGLRLGVHEITRWGMGTEQMQQIGALVADVLFKRRGADAVRHDVIALKQSFEQLHYCFPRE
jgi:glycine hydroxymethyltransferase